MKKPKRTRVTVTMTFSLAEAKNQPGWVSFRVGSWNWHSLTPRQAQKLIAKQLRKMVSDP